MRKTRILNSIMCLTTTLVIILFLLSSCEKEVSVTSPDAPPPKGKLIIYSLPEGFDIFLNSKNRVRITPDSINWLKTDSYYITLKNRLFKDSSFSVDVEDGERIQLFIDFTKNKRMYGKIFVQSSPKGADIELDNVKTNKQTPAYIDDVFPGVHSITISMSDHNSNTSLVEVKSQNTHYIKAALVDTTIWQEVNTENSGLPFNRITSVTFENENIMWLGSRNGLIRYDGNNYMLLTPDNSDLPHQVVNKVRADKYGNIWVGTNSGIALAKGQLISKRWSLSLAPESVYSISIDYAKGNVYFASSSYFSKIKIDDLTINQEKIENYSNFTSVAYNTSNIYVGSLNSGLFVRTELGWRVFTKINSKIAGNSVRAIYPASSGLWMSHTPSESGGWQLSLLNGQDSFENYSLKAPPYPSIDIIFEDKHGNFLLGSDLGLFIFKDVNNSVLFNELNTGLPIINITDITEDLKGNIWITTWNNGVFVLKDIEKLLSKSNMQTPN